MGFFNKGTSTSQFFVWYLGSKEANGIRGHSAALPAIRYLLNDSFMRTPNKATLQVSDNGLKLTQTLPIMRKNGRIKSRRVKFQIAASSITYCMISEAPFDDVIAVIIVANNPEMSSPIHVHCYRCDNSETARLLYDNIQTLIERTEMQRSIVTLEERLFLSGILPVRVVHSSDDDIRNLQRRRTFQELKRKSSILLETDHNKGGRSVSTSDQHRCTSSSDHKQAAIGRLPRWNIQPEPNECIDSALLHERKSLSVDNLALSSRICRKYDERTPITFESSWNVNDILNGVRERSSNFGAFWKRSLNVLNNL